MPAVIYRTKDRPSAEEAFALLRGAGFSPLFLGDPDRYRGPGLKVYYLAEIAVPDDEADRARKVLSDWESGRVRDIGEHLREIRRKFWRPIVITCVLGVIWVLVFPQHAEFVCLGIPLIAFCVLLFLGYYKSWVSENCEKRRNRRGRRRWRRR
jgi:hypothetical protein